MRDLSTLAKLLAEEDIHVIHRNQPTAMFDVKNRELSLPIWKEMSKNVQDLMTLHEVGHALWTPLDMLETAKKEKIEFSFVNVLEDVRIEKLVQKKYPGSVRTFNNGYKELIEQDFFQTVGKDIVKFNLIDRINLHFKHNVAVPFSDKEKVWVQKANQTKTPQDVLELAKELYEYISENEESQGENQEEDSQSMMNSEGGSPETMEMPSSDNSQEENSEKESEEHGDNGNTSDSKPEDEGSNPSAPAKLEEEKSEETDEEKVEVKTSSGSEGGKSDDNTITSATDNAWNESSKKLLNDDGKEYRTAFIPELDLKKTVVSTSSLLDDFNKHYSDKKRGDTTFFDKTLEELNKTKNDSKKTIGYMVKEFEMKKSADQYARASTSKTGTLDMGALHTYKFNDDLFAKVTTLPGATNHGLVMFLDWSGSMSGNLKGTLNQLYNLIWFCKKVNIPFDVYAFTDYYNQKNRYHASANEFKSGDLKVDQFNLLHFFSSKMKNKDEFTMMHNLYMVASQWTYRDWRTEGYPYNCPKHLNLGGTPLNHTIIAAMQIVPEFKKTSGVQKVHTIFLTDGSSHKIGGVFKLKEQDGETFESYEGIYGYGVNVSTYVDQKYGNKAVSTSYKDSRDVQMSALLDLLKKRLPDASLVNFFVAGSGRKGNVKSDAIRYVLDYNAGWRLADELAKEIKKENVAIVENAQGFDTVYILPGLGGIEMDSELEVEVGASKAQLKRAFSKMAIGKTVNRPLLNNFIKMVA